LSQTIRELTLKSPIDSAANETFPFAFSIAASNSGKSLDAEPLRQRKTILKDPAEKSPAKKAANLTDQGVK
jgi:hypothetical protein